MDPSLFLPLSGDWGEVDVSEEFGNTIKAVTDQVAYCPSRCDVLQILTPSSAAFLKAWVTDRTVFNRINRGTIFYEVVSRGTLSIQELSRLEDLARPRRGAVIDPDAMDSEMAEIVSKVKGHWFDPSPRPENLDQLLAAEFEWRKFRPLADRGARA